MRRVVGCALSWLRRSLCGPAVRRRPGFQQRLHAPSRSTACGSGRTRTRRTTRRSRRSSTTRRAASSTCGSPTRARSRSRACATRRLRTACTSSPTATSRLPAAVPFPTYGANTEPQFEFPRAAKIGSDWKLADLDREQSVGRLRRLQLQRERQRHRRRSVDARRQLTRDRFSRPTARARSARRPVRTGIVNGRLYVEDDRHRRPVEVGVQRRRLRRA